MRPWNLKCPEASQPVCPRPDAEPRPQIGVPLGPIAAPFVACSRWPLGASGDQGLCLPLRLPGPRLRASAPEVVAPQRTGDENRVDFHVLLTKEEQRLWARCLNGVQVFLTSSLLIPQIYLVNLFGTKWSHAPAETSSGGLTPPCPETGRVIPDPGQEGQVHSFSLEAPSEISL